MSKLGEFDIASDFAANAKLFEWLSDDAHRAKLLDEMKASRPVLRFKSIEGWDGVDPATASDVYLIAGPGVAEALQKQSVQPYQALGGGKFMLAIDEREHHAAQRHFAVRRLSYGAATTAQYAERAFEQAAVLPLKQTSFDVPLLAEQTALRFVATLFGLAPEHHFLLQQTMRVAYRKLCQRIIGRHFVDDAAVLPPPRPAPAKDLATVLAEHVADARTATAHRRGRPRTVIERLARSRFAGNTEFIKALLIGLLTGTVGNVQAAVSIVIDDLFNSNPANGEPWPIDLAREEALSGDQDALWTRIVETLTRHPPTTFLPRRTFAEFDVVDSNGSCHRVPRNSDLLLAIESAALPELVFGGPHRGGAYHHQCIGDYLVQPLIIEIVRSILALPGLAQVVDPMTGRPKRLVKRLGMICEAFPLSYDRARRLNQWPLNVVMNVKPPVAENAKILATVIAAGAPQIEARLNESRHVHFAWFQLINGGTQLALHTVYDGDFDAYIEHFALKVDLFDVLFKYIEDAPPLPVREHPKEFVETIFKHDKTPYGEYFYSAYPTTAVAQIANAAKRGDL